MLDLFFQTETPPPPFAPSQKKEKQTAKRKPRERKDKPKERHDPVPAIDPMVSFHAAFTPLPPEKNVPNAVEDPFEETFGVPDEDEAALWEFDAAGGEDDEVEEDVESRGSAGYGASLDDSDDDVGSICSRSPLRSADYQSFVSRWRRGVSTREPRAVYTGPQLMLDDEDDDTCAF
jgi:hypothetical protein